MQALVSVDFLYKPVVGGGCIKRRDKYRSVVSGIYTRQLGADRFGVACIKIRVVEGRDFKQSLYKAVPGLV